MPTGTIRTRLTVSQTASTSDSSGPTPFTAQGDDCSHSRARPVRSRRQHQSGVLIPSERSTMHKSDESVVFRAPRIQVIIGLSFSLLYFLITSALFAALLTAGDLGPSIFLLCLTLLAAWMNVHLGWRVARSLELTDASLYWRAAFRRGEVPIGLVRDASQVGQRRNSSWKLELRNGKVIYLANSREVGPLLAKVVRAANADETGYTS
jgi:hypothetical protein